MLSLVILALLIVSIFKPDVLVSKKLSELASDEQYQDLVSCSRISYVFILLLIEVPTATTTFLGESWVTIILLVILLAAFLAFGLKKVIKLNQLRKEILYNSEED